MAAIRCAPTQRSCANRQSRASARQATQQAKPAPENAMASGPPPATNNATGSRMKGCSVTTKSQISMGSPSNLPTTCAAPSRGVAWRRTGSRVNPASESSSSRGTVNPIVGPTNRSGTHRDRNGIRWAGAPQLLKATTARFASESRRGRITGVRKQSGWVCSYIQTCLCLARR